MRLYNRVGSPDVWIFQQLRIMNYQFNPTVADDLLVYNILHWNSDPGGILTRALQNRNLTFYTAKLRGLAITVV